MQTFLPYKSFKASAIVLDKRRLNKQVIEAHQILRTLDGLTVGWSNHPVMKMWKGHREALIHYIRAMIDECLTRGINQQKMSKEYFYIPDVRKWPRWLGDEAFHSSHRSNLIRKDPIWYCQFGWDEEPTQPYIWPEA